MSLPQIAGSVDTPAATAAMHGAAAARREERAPRNRGSGVIYGCKIKRYHLEAKFQSQLQRLSEESGRERVIRTEGHSRADVYSRL